ncbi:uncharacterized protein LOC111313253 [Durio zibethinus]|uniref:Uncharacterized protein LOC111313253 n=1 Tax=Durio zibethinus TaxID=66656 RepID=A0A6P6AXY8_DURZI|nr:uncharacterized protein LOC111313253 [Durio zibethinus]
MVGSSFRGWCRFFQYDEGTKEDDKQKNRAQARNALLVVATLIATMTFQAGVNPPGGIWQSSEDGTNKKAGTAIFASEPSPYYVFLTSNTLAFSAALLVIMSLTHKFPFQFEVRVASISMIITYGSSIFFVTANDATKFRLVLIVAAAPLMIRCLIQLLVSLRTREDPPCLIQVIAKPRNKTTEPLRDEIQPAQT